MPYQDPKPNAFRRGQTGLSAKALNQIRDSIPRETRGVGDVSVRDYGDRTIVDSNTIQAWMPDTKNFIQQFIFIEEYDDYLACIPYDLIQGPMGWGNPYILEQLYSDEGIIDTKGYPLVYVAKPFALQMSPWYADTTLPFPITVYETTITSISAEPAGAVNTRAVSGFVTINGVQSVQFGEYQVITPPYVLGEAIMAAQTTTGQLTPGSQPVPIMWMDMNSGAKAWALDVNYPYNTGG